eukprot:scaffold64686_cov69-Phaeocystis_antarctica.AAC.1
MCRILAIYMDTDGFGKQGTNFSLSKDKKRNGFLWGIWGPKQLTGDALNVEQLLWYPGKAPNAREMTKMEQIWPAVFPVTPPITGRNKFPKALLDMNIQEMSTKSRRDEDVCKLPAFKK